MKDAELRERIRKKTPEILSLVNWLFAYRNVSFWMVRSLIKTKIKPNQVTIFGILVFLTSIVLIGSGQHKYMIIGAIMGIFCVYLDYIDGGLARAKGMTSQFGKALDSASCHLELILIPLAITSALYLQTRKDLFLLLGAVVVVNTFMYFVGRKNILYNNKNNDKIDQIKTLKSGPNIGWHTFFEVDTRLLFFWLGCIFNRLLYMLIYFLIWSFYEIFRMYLSYSKKLS